jgi:hypothetical protein
MAARHRLIGHGHPLSSRSVITTFFTGGTLRRAARGLCNVKLPCSDPLSGKFSPAIADHVGSLEAIIGLIP